MSKKIKSLKIAAGVYTGLTLWREVGFGFFNSLAKQFFPVRVVYRFLVNGWKSLKGIFLSPFRKTFPLQTKVVLKFIDEVFKLDHLIMAFVFAGLLFVLYKIFRGLNYKKVFTMIKKRLKRRNKRVIRDPGPDTAINLIKEEATDTMLVIEKNGDNTKETFVDLGKKSSYKHGNQFLVKKENDSYKCIFDEQKEALLHYNQQKALGRNCLVKLNKQSYPVPSFLHKPSFFDKNTGFAVDKDRFIKSVDKNNVIWRFEYKNDSGVVKELFAQSPEKKGRLINPDDEALFADYSFTYWGKGVLPTSVTLHYTLKDGRVGTIDSYARSDVYVKSDFQERREKVKVFASSFDEECYVVALLGDIGSGKSSLLHSLFYALNFSDFRDFYMNGIKFSCKHPEREELDLKRTQIGERYLYKVTAKIGGTCKSIYFYDLAGELSLSEDGDDGFVKSEFLDKDQVNLRNRTIHNVLSQCHMVIKCSSVLQMNGKENYIGDMEFIDSVISEYKLPVVHVITKADELSGNGNAQLCSNSLVFKEAYDRHPCDRDRAIREHMLRAKLYADAKNLSYSDKDAVFMVKNHELFSRGGQKYVDNSKSVNVLLVMAYMMDILFGKNTANR